MAPVLHVVPAELAKELNRYAQQGHLITTYFSGVVDENDHVWLGGYPSALRELLGIRVEEFGPLLADHSVRLDDGTTGALWTDRDHRHGRRHTGPGPLRDRRPGRPPRHHPPYNRRRFGLVRLHATRRRRPDLAAAPLLELAGVHSELPEALRGRVELVVRRGEGGRFIFLFNRTDEPVPVPAAGGQLLVRTGDAHGTDGAVVLGPREVAVLRQPVGREPAG